jgi:phosphate transport system permease protein
MTLKAPANYDADRNANREIKKMDLRGCVADKLIWTFGLVVSGLGILLGIFSLSLNSLEAFPVPLLGFLAFYLLLLFFYCRYTKKLWERKFIILFGISAILALGLHFIPLYWYGLQISGIIHRSFFSAIFLLAVATPSFCYILYYFLGATPKANDISHYPILVLPILIILAAYLIILGRLLILGIPNLNWHIIMTPYLWQSWTTEVWNSGWPQWVSHYIHQPGIRNYILGTLLLILLTSVISLPIGMAVGIYITEYSKGFMTQIIKLSCSALRSISVFILGLTAISLVALTRTNFLAAIFAGFFYGEDGKFEIATGSFITAAIVISMLVIPIIARATEEGIRSTPKEIKEGSIALGTSHLYTLNHILIPWSLPNIITGFLLGCAEAAGSLATIWFISGTGERGLTPFSPPTSLSFFIYLCLGDQNVGFKATEQYYEYSAALILIIITIGLSIAVLLIKRRLNRRLKGA